MIIIQVFRLRVNSIRKCKSVRFTRSAAVASWLLLPTSKRSAYETLYTQLTLEQRYQIQALLKPGHRYTEIAHIVGIHPSTICREVRRNQGCRGYRPQQPHRFTLTRRRTKTHRRIPGAIWHRVDRLLQEQWSPEQISGFLRTGQEHAVGHEWIYQYVYHDKRTHGALYRHLRSQRQRRKRYGTYSCRGHLPNCISIERRPAVVERRTRLGDWAGYDDWQGPPPTPGFVNRTQIAVEPHRQFPRHCAHAVTTAVIALLKPLSLPLHTLTSDNGKEFAHHETIARPSRCVTFFLRLPMRPWNGGLTKTPMGSFANIFSSTGLSRPLPRRNSTGNAGQVRLNFRKDATGVNPWRLIMVLYIILLLFDYTFSAVGFFDKHVNYGRR